MSLPTPMPAASKPPYPPSPMIRGVQFDWNTHRRMAPGSDNWPITWADDDNQYAAWGDGGGFGGTNTDGRVSLGIARIEGDAEHYIGINVWGGKNAENPAQFPGKSYGILCIQGILYMWVAHQPGPHQHASQLAWSENHGAAWHLADWQFNYADGLTIPTFLNFGKNYRGARDQYVYSYAIAPTWGPGKPPHGGRRGFAVHHPGTIYLLRVPKQHILDRGHYECFAGISPQGIPAWSADLTQKKPVFQDPNGVGWTVSVSFNRPLRRYILCTEHDQTFSSRLGMFDAPEPWGPWTTILYENAWGQGQIQPNIFYWNFANKWLSDTGLEFTLLFTGIDKNDAWNSIRGRFLLRKPGPR